MKFMCCYDGSDACNEALKLAREWAKRFSADLHVVASRGDPGGSAEPGLSGIKSELQKEGARWVETVPSDDETAGENLVGYAEREGVDAMFIGVRQVSKVGKLLFGSTAQYVILSAPCPVISVKGGTAAGK